MRPAARLDRRALAAVAVLLVLAAAAAHLSPVLPPSGSPERPGTFRESAPGPTTAPTPVPPLPGDGGVVGSLLLLLPLYGVLRFVGRFGRGSGTGR